MTFDLSEWHPIASASDLPLRHVYHGQLMGRELAVWRADDGYVNVWENRCLHRGVRLSVGLNDGRELKCLYHGWRYANRTAGCTYIPAHPADAPARTICNNTYQCVEAQGLIWSAIEPVDACVAPDLFDGEEPLVLRPIPVNAAPQLVHQLAKDYCFSPTGQGAAEVELIEETSGYLKLRSRLEQEEASLFIFVQPVDAGRSVLRGVLDKGPADRLALLRHHNRAMTELRNRIEDEAARLPAPQPLDVSFARVSAELATMPERPKAGPKAELRVRIAKKLPAADGVVAVRMEALSGQLPTFQPGAHIDVHLPNGLTRQYSITNAPGETDHYTIGVKLEPASRGGSACLHNDVREGDVLAVSAPRNNFPLRRDALRTVLIAGGIGITPMLAMAQTLHMQDHAFELHVFAQSEGQVAFPWLLSQLGSNVTRHLALGPEETVQALEGVLDGYDYAHHTYICGPAPMLDAARAIAAKRGWPDEAVHFEYFKNTNTVDDSTAFEVALARSALTLRVPAGKTILEILRENGIDAPSSCEQGACGTCLATVIEGVPEHQDVYLSDAEKASNDKIITCVSRARSKRLVLDI